MHGKRNKESFQQVEKSTTLLQTSWQCDNATNWCEGATKQGINKEPCSTPCWAKSRLLNNCCERVANKLRSTKQNEELQSKAQTKKLQMKKLKQNVGI
jgi:hypothetical protein